MVRPDLSASARLPLWSAMRVASAATISIPMVTDTMNSISVRPRCEPGAECVFMSARLHGKKGDAHRAPLRFGAVGTGPAVDARRRGPHGLNALPGHRDLEHARRGVLGHAAAGRQNGTH